MNSIIEIKIDGIPIPTREDEDGVLRLPCNPKVQALFVSGALDVTKLSPELKRWVYLNVGASVKHYQEVFPDDLVVGSVEVANSTDAPSIPGLATLSATCSHRANSPAQTYRSCGEVDFADLLPETLASTAGFLLKRFQEESQGKEVVHRLSLNISAGPGPAAHQAHTQTPA